MPKYSLKEKYVLVTGSSSGIGKELAREFAGEGAHCILASLPGEKEALLELAKELETDYNVRTWCIFSDLSDPQGVERLYERVKSITEKLDVLVNNAGIMQYGRFTEIDFSIHDRILMVNARAYMALMHYFLSDMVKAGEGRVLNICSVSAFQPSPSQAVYGATKAFIQSISEAVHQEVKDSGIKVCTLNPSYTDTPLLRGDGFPTHLWWYYICGLSSPAKIAQLGMKGLKKGKTVYVPGIRNKLFHVVLSKLLPRKIISFISRMVLQEKG